MNNEPLLKVYCGELRPKTKYLEILNPNFGFKKRKNIFGDKDVFDDISMPFVEVVSDPSQADFLLIPHNYFRVKKDVVYVKSFVDLSKKFSKKIIIFAIGDSTEHIEISNSIILRMSQYASQKRNNEIIIPAYAADLSYGEPVQYRTKKGDERGQGLPIVGFCGWAGTYNIIKIVRDWFKNSFILKGPYRLGLYFRKKTISVLNNSHLVKTNFIIRTSYGASKSTVKVDPKKARAEYRQNIIESDFVLAPKGDGNFSVRFYEALSLGRIPLLIDTDCPLPLDKDLDYSKFILKVSYEDIDKLDEIVSDFYAKKSTEEWSAMQREARRAFDQHLRIDVFFRYILTRESLEKYSS